MKRITPCWKLVAQLKRLVRTKPALLILGGVVALITSGSSTTILAKEPAGRISLEPWKGNSILPSSVVQQVDLVQQLFAQTNHNFDAKICKSLRANSGQPVVISYHLISFTFYHSVSNEFVASHTEMGNPDELVCRHGEISRTELSTNEIPLNYIRVVDSSKKQITAELDLFLGVAPLENQQNVKYFRRSFRFVYKNGWKED